MRRNSFSAAEALLAQSIMDKEKIVYRPVHVWTELDSSEQILQKKTLYRERYGWEIDFEDYQSPFAKNITTRINKMGGIEA